MNDFPWARQKHCNQDNDTWGALVSCQVIQDEVGCELLTESQSEIFQPTNPGALFL